MMLHGFLPPKYMGRGGDFLDPVYLGAKVLYFQDLGGKNHPGVTDDYLGGTNP